MKNIVKLLSTTALVFATAFCCAKTDKYTERNQEIFTIADSVYKANNDSLKIPIEDKLDVSDFIKKQDPDTRLIASGYINGYEAEDWAKSVSDLYGLKNSDLINSKTRDAILSDFWSTSHSLEGIGYCRFAQAVEKEDIEEQKKLLHDANDYYEAHLELYQAAKNNPSQAIGLKIVKSEGEIDANLARTFMNLAKLHFVRYEIGDDPYGITLGSAIGNLLMAERITPIHSKYDVWRALGQHYEGIGDLHSASKAYTCGLKQVSNNINNYDIEVQKQYGMQNAADWFINKLHQL